ncbi:hypothetical protein N303_05539, partial [Cuculus canorus]
AIDFLLLAHGHRCEDFEGICCINLSERSWSVHKVISTLLDRTKKLKMDNGFFELENLLNS